MQFNCDGICGQFLVSSLFYEPKVKICRNNFHEKMHEKITKRWYTHCGCCFFAKINFTKLGE